MESVLSILTVFFFEMCQELETTLCLQEIATEKAGIFKTGSPALTILQEPEAQQALEVSKKPLLLKCVSGANKLSKRTGSVSGHESLFVAEKGNRKGCTAEGRAGTCPLLQRPCRTTQHWSRRKVIILAALSADSPFILKVFGP